MHALGMHLLVELRDCNPKILSDLKKVEEILVTAAKAAKATIVQTHFHQFSPFGISGVVIIAESHLSVHTWPEYGYAAVDIFTCGDTLKPELAASSVIERFHSKQPSIIEVKRGILSRDNVKLPHKAVKGEAIEYARTKELQMVP